MVIDEEPEDTGNQNAQQMQNSLKCRERVTDSDIEDTAQDFRKAKNANTSIKDKVYAK